MRVAVLGAGYVGLALCRRLVAADHEVVGVRRSSLDRVRATGADALAADVTDPDALAAVPDVDAVVFAASAGGRDAAAARETYVAGLRTVVETFGARPSPPRLIYTSSTGVYGDHDGGWVDETTPIDPVTPRAEALLAAERLVREVAPEHGLAGTVVRFAGLYGPDRYRLSRYLDGPIAPGHLNLLHRADAAGVCRFLLERAPDVDLVVAVDDDPVDRRELARWLADQCGVARPPERSLTDRLAGVDSAAARRRIQADKRCSNARLRSLGYEFTYPTYREGYRAAIEAYRDDTAT